MSVGLYMYSIGRRLATEDVDAGLLQKRGYDIGGDHDGHAGTKSQAAIADFQQRDGLEVNGRPSVKVLAVGEYT